METGYLTIGQMADLNHISTQTLRLYDREGLLKPGYQDPSNGYRYYLIDQCAQLDMIHTMKICGMSLQQIRTQLTHASAQELQALLLEQDAALRQQIRRLSNSRRSIARIVSNLKQLGSLPPVGQVFFEYMPKRIIDTIVTQIDFFTQGYAGYERMLLELKGKMLRQNLPMSYFFNAGTLIEQADLTAGRYVARTAFIFVDEDYPASDTIRVVPEGLSMAICAHDPEQELDYARQLCHEIQTAGYQIAGDYLCEVISQFPLSEDNKRDLVYKIQVPVRRDR